VFPRIAWILAAVLAAGALCVLYGVFIERRWFRLMRYRLNILPAGTDPLTILHLSDLHYLPRDKKMASFIASIPQADVTVITGDLLGGPEAVESVVETLKPARGRYGSYFVLGSNDYYTPKPLNYFRYFKRKHGLRLGTRGRASDLITQMTGAGWTALVNQRVGAQWNGSKAEVVGIDDPHIHRDDLRSAPRHKPEVFGLGIVHSPDAAPELAALGYDLVVAGHTHGGQVRMPVVGALVNNSVLPVSFSRGLYRIGGSYLHISAGLGSSKYAPFRFWCRPEATMLELGQRS
jgi:predicted MPP superfamily phosphohydrolase